MGSWLRDIRSSRVQFDFKLCCHSRVDSRCQENGRSVIGLDTVNDGIGIAHINEPLAETVITISY